MREILMRPEMYKCKTFREFAKEFQIGERDLIFTNHFIYEPFMEELGLSNKFCFIEEYGQGEPSEESITRIFEALDPADYDRIIAVGGGAVMDVAKVLSLKRVGSVHDLYFRKLPVIPEKELIAIPTTCGTGSEVTNISIAIVKEDNGNTTKLGLVDDLIIPKKICLIPELLTTLPYKPFASSAIDALIHAVESYLSPSRATMTSELFGVKAMELILEGFRRIAEEGRGSRMSYGEEFLTAATYAGLAFLQAGCATVHAMSFPLGGTYHVPHGESNYLLFGKVLEKYDAIKPDGKLRDFKQTIARILGGTEEQAIANLNELLEKILHLKPLREYGMREEDIEVFTDSVIANQQRLVTNSYVPLTRDLIMEIYRELY
ncbi:MAG: 4-hydroxybutyrate dehydrogenase [Firmicutes bacterium]|nr:4-hydroxybutyrate dehydrogenase [Bacillota bacterium]